MPRMKNATKEERKILKTPVRTLQSFGFTTSPPSEEQKDKERTPTPATAAKTSDGSSVASSSKHSSEASLSGPPESPSKHKHNEYKLKHHKKHHHEDPDQPESLDNAPEPDTALKERLQIHKLQTDLKIELPVRHSLRSTNQTSANTDSDGSTSGLAFGLSQSVTSAHVILADKGNSNTLDVKSEAETMKRLEASDSATTSSSKRKVEVSTPQTNVSSEPPMKKVKIVHNPTQSIIISPRNSAVVSQSKPLEVRMPNSPPKRERKPSQRLLLALGADLELQEPHKPGTAESQAKPKTESQAKPRKSTHQADAQRLERNEDGVEAERIFQCYCCHVVADKGRTHHCKTYCYPCSHIIRQYISKNVLPDCKEDDCDKKSYTTCRGCRCLLVNASMPEEKRVKLRKTDSRQQYLQQAIDFHDSGQSAVSADAKVQPLRAIPKAAVAPPKILSVMSPQNPINSTRTVSPIKLQTSPGKSQRIILTLPASSQLHQSLISAMKPNSSKPQTITVNLNQSGTSDALKIAALESLATQPRVTTHKLVSPNQALKIRDKLQGIRIVESPVKKVPTVSLIRPTIAPQLRNQPLKIIRLDTGGAGVQNSPYVIVKQRPVGQQVFTLPSGSRTIQVQPKPAIATTTPPVLESATPALSIRPRLTDPEDPGPRVKHVSRSASKVQGQGMPAMVGPHDGLRLSALPVEEKERIYDEYKESLAASDEDDRPRKKAKTKYKEVYLEEDDGENSLISGSLGSGVPLDDDDEDWERDHDVKKQVKRSPKMTIKTKFIKKQSGPALSGSKRRPRCGKCEGCHAENCRICAYCRDMKKYGGPGKMKQCCIERRCKNKEGPLYALSRSESGSGRYAPSDRSESPALSMPSRRARPAASRAPQRHRETSSSASGSVCTADTNLSELMDLEMDPNDIALSAEMSNKPLQDLLSVSTGRGKTAEAASRKSAGTPPLPPLLAEEAEILADQNAGFSLVESLHRLMADFIDTFDIDKMWQQGMAVVTTYKLSVNSICFLCGSAGHHEFIYCTVCCEPFHEFCLDTKDAPPRPGATDWMCRRCCYCTVCRQPENLVTCRDCSQLYHAHCVTPGFPVIPDGSWLCEKCVKCKSCGVTRTSEREPPAWSANQCYCLKCQELRDRGNYCPICEVCYADDDWDCKMIGCTICDSWTHAKCENLSDDLYEIIGFVDESEAQYVCKRCDQSASNNMQTDPPNWLVALHNSRLKAFEIILTSLMSRKHTSALCHINSEELKKFYETHNNDLSKSKPNARLTGDVSIQSADISSISADTSIESTAPKETPNTVPHATESDHLSQTTSEKDIDPSKEDINPSKEDIDTSKENVNPSKEDINPSKEDIDPSNEDIDPGTVSEASDGKKEELDDSQLMSPPSSSVKKSKTIRPATSTPDSRTTRRSLRRIAAIEASDEPEPEPLLAAPEAPETELESPPPTRSTRSSARNGEKKPTKHDEKATQPNKKSTQPNKKSTQPNRKSTRPSEQPIQPNGKGAQTNSKPQKIMRRTRSQAGSEASTSSEPELAVSHQIRPETSTPKCEAESALPTLVRRSSRRSKHQPDLSSSDELDIHPHHSGIQEMPREIKQELIEEQGTMIPTRRSTRRPASSSTVGPETASAPVSSKAKSSNSSSEKTAQSSMESKPAASSDKQNTSLGSTLADTSIDSAASVYRGHTSIDSTASDHIVAYDHLNLARRFHDVDWQLPPINFENLSANSAPLDLAAVKTRVGCDGYQSITRFLDDVIRIVQGGISRSKFQNVKAAKSMLATKKLLEAEVKTLFPWIDINKSESWLHNLGVPRNAHDNASMPPYDDHLYSVWLIKNELPLSSEPLPILPSEIRSIEPKRPSSTQSNDSVKEEEKAIKFLPSLCEQTTPDTRRCILCSQLGDDAPNDAGRLIYAGGDDWVHVNCALWSCEVFEEVDGTLQSVHSAIARGKAMECLLCGLKGATIGCCAKGCVANFHFMCARRSFCQFMFDKQVFCSNCHQKAVGETVDPSTFSTCRTVTIDFSHAKIKKPWQRGFTAADLHISIGNLFLNSFGRITPDSDFLNILVPIGFSITRTYWSTANPRQRCLYTCKVTKIRADRPSDTPDMLPDVVVCHDPDVESYTPPELLASKYPDIFQPSVYGGIEDVSSESDSSEKRISKRDYRKEFPNLKRIAAALNKAAKKSYQKHHFKPKAPVRLYGSASGDAADDVAEIMELVTSDMNADDQEELEERDVIIVKDVDEDLAQEMMVQIGKLSEEQIDSMGGIQAVIDKFMNKTKKTATPEESSSPKPSEPIDTSEPARSPTEPRGGSGPQQTYTKEERLRKLGQLEPIKPPLERSMKIDLALSGSGTLQRYSSCPETGSELLSPTSASLLSPPKIVITDFSSGKPEIRHVDPITGDPINEPSPSMVVSCGTKDKLKSLVRKRSESLGDISSINDKPPMSLPLGESWVKRRSSLSDARITTPTGDPRTAARAISSQPTLELERVSVPSESFCVEDDEMCSLSSSEVSEEAVFSDDLKCIESPVNSKSSSPATVDSGGDKSEQVAVPTVDKSVHVTVVDVDKSVSVMAAANDTEKTVIMMDVDKPGLDDVKSESMKEDDKPGKSARRSLPKTERMDIVTTERMDIVTADEIQEKTEETVPLRERRAVNRPMKLDEDNSICLPPSPESPDGKSSAPVRFPCKWKFENNFLNSEKEELDVNLNEWIVLRDRTPAASSDSDSDASQATGSTSRIVCAPAVSCYVREDIAPSQLPNILNARVVVDRLPVSDDETPDDKEPAATLPDNGMSALSYINTISGALDTSNIPNNAPATLKEVSREIRKDIINYCEDDSSSSTDEDDLVPAKSLRQRKKVNYNENKRSEDEEKNTTDKKDTSSKTVRTKVLVSKDGSIKRKMENIPSELQKTISDAIRKARQRTGERSAYPSASQSYSGASGAGGYSLNPRFAPQRTDVTSTSHIASDAEFVRPRIRRAHPSRDGELAPSPTSELIGDDCQLTMVSSDNLSSQLEGLPDKPNQRSVNGRKPSPVVLSFEISNEHGYKCQGSNWNDAWRQVTETLVERRKALACPDIAYCAVDGLAMFGLDHTSVAYFTEQLYGARFCHSYRFRFHKPPLMEYEEELVETMTGSARSDGFSTRKKPDMFSFIDSRFRSKPLPLGPDSKDSYQSVACKRVTSTELPMAMKFRHIKTTANEAVGVYGSSIHGRGLFCKRKIDTGEMVIEYAGEVIRQTLCDSREKYYESRGIGCYMFRVDRDLVVDATMKGNAGRFINHSCEPNCYSKVIDVNGEKHIVIFALRDILRGEELTYDYKFPYEEDKIPCSCGAKKCRGFLN